MSRRVALLCMTPTPDTDEFGRLELPSYGIRRIEAAVRADPALDDCVVELIGLGRDDRDGYLQRLSSFQPDLIGVSVYVWSANVLIEVAKAWKKLKPSTTVIFGGPSARTVFFDLPPYAGAETYLDAVVEGDGEEIFCTIAGLPKIDRDVLEELPGLALPQRIGWHRTKPAPATRLNRLASPFQMDLMAPGSVAYLETYRGCPLSCRFCEWGVAKDLRAVFSTDYITRELDAYAEQRAPVVLLLDAGLNLNGHAFRNLRAAHERNPYLREVAFWAEVYPASVKDTHLEFLEDVGASYLGVGLQSYDMNVLKGLDRPQNGDKFVPSIHRLADVANIEVQIIFGLPGDTPEGFWRTLNFAMSLPVKVRAYHCLVLPDALLTRSRREWNVKFNPRTLAMTSNSTWSRDQLAAMRARLTNLAGQIGGKSGDFMWSFPQRRRVEKAIG